MYWSALAALTLLVYFIVRSMRAFKRRFIWHGVDALDPYAQPDTLPADVIYKQLPVLGTHHIALYYRMGNPWLPWIVHCHGIRTNCEGSYELFERVGADTANVLVWDYRGFGRSTGTSDETVTLYDLQSILQWLERAYRVDTEHDVVLMGHSLGTNVVLRYMARDTVQPLPRRVVLCHPFYRLSDVFAFVGIPSLLAYVVGNMDASNALKRYFSTDTVEQRQVLLLGTKHDGITPWNAARKLGEQFEHVEVHDVGGTHNRTTERMWAEICEFIST